MPVLHDYEQKASYIDFSQLHWLPVKACCHYKLAMLASPFFDGKSCSYLAENLHQYIPSRKLHANEKFLEGNSYKLKTASGRSFTKDAPKI